MPRRIDAGELLAALGGLLVLVGLFLAWFGELTGWEAFETLDLVLAVLGLAVLAVAAAGLGASAPVGPRALLPLGALLLLVVGVQLIEPPPAVGEEEVGRGAWLGLAGTVLVLVGGLLRVARIDVTVSVGARDARRRVPAVDRRSAARSASARRPIFDEGAPGRPALDDAPPAGSGPEGGGPGGAAAVHEAARRRDEPGLRDPDATQPLSAVDEEP